MASKFSFGAKEEIGLIDKSRKSVIKAYKSEPGDFDSAAHAAYHYASKQNKDMAIVPSNSYGRSLYQIAPFEKLDLKYYAIFSNAKIGIVDTEGRVYSCLVTYHRNT